MEKLHANIKKRNRAYEQNIPDQYLTNIQDTYTNYIRQQNTKTLFVDVTHADFLYNDQHLQSIIEALDKPYENGIHYIHLS